EAKSPVARPANHTAHRVASAEAHGDPVAFCGREIRLDHHAGGRQFDHLDLALSVVPERFGPFVAHEVTPVFAAVVIAAAGQGHHVGLCGALVCGHWRLQADNETTR